MNVILLVSITAAFIVFLIGAFRAEKSGWKDLQKSLHNPAKDKHRRAAH